MARTEAIITGGSDRLRPILITACTTILGLFPLVAPLVAPGLFGPVEGRAGTWGPIGLAVVGGLTTSTFMTLVVMPTIYTLFDDLANYLRRVVRAMSPAHRQTGQPLRRRGVEVHRHGRLPRRTDCAFHADAMCGQSRQAGGRLVRQFWRRRNGTGLALAGLLSLAVVLGGCDVVNNILGRGGQTAGAAGGFGAGAAGGGFGGQTAAVPVVTADVVRETVSNFLVATTTLSAERSLDVLARASGEVVEVLVEEGDAVREGQLLAQLDPSDARLALAEAQAHYDNIQREYERTSELAKHGGVTDQELENQRYQIELRTIALDRSRQQLADTEVRSPITGIVGERSVNRGLPSRPTPACSTCSISIRCWR